ncbi:MAG: type II toxin-antitoxin system HicA family toxin [Oscillospiraceae bacterium]|nr:type II toxin-antitoxin system HicA family toxin [Oscillospiraceae bacterium]
MGKKEKLIERLISNPKDFTFNEMHTVLISLGFKIFTKGKTSGSRVKFIRGNIAIILHKPHPRKELLEYQIKQVLDILKKENMI